MNFFQRRRILKRANYLELVPVRMHIHQLSAEGKVVIVVPKFKSEKFARWFIPKRKSTTFTVRLDELGSVSWLAIDGHRNVKDIAGLLDTQFEMKEGEAAYRLTKFLTQLYDQRYVSFTALQQ